MNKKLRTTNQAARARIKMLSTALLLLAALALIPFASAHPPFPTVFYGAVYERNAPAAAGSIVQAWYNGTPCDTFVVTNKGYYGVLSCPGDDPGTAIQDGAAPGEAITFTLNGALTAIISGDATFTAKSFKEVNISHPLPVCGDGFCDRFFENVYNCPFDCRNGTSPPNQTTNQSTNQSINVTTNQTGNVTPPSGGGGGGGGAVWWRRRWRGRWRRGRWFCRNNPCVPRLVPW